MNTPEAEKNGKGTASSRVGTDCPETDGTTQSRALPVWRGGIRATLWNLCKCSEAPLTATCTIALGDDRLASS
jgi:hypothetical protein